MAVAFGFDRADSAHQVGAGRLRLGRRCPGGPPTPTTRRPRGLGGSDAASGQTDGALEQRLRFDRSGRAARPDDDRRGARRRRGALTRLRRGRGVAFAASSRAERRDWHRFLAPPRLPAGGGRRRDRRRQALADHACGWRARPKTGAIVASVNTQGPYGEDWIRDGSFINSLLDAEGLHGWVTKHNLFYARIQASPQHPSADPPAGQLGDGVVLRRRRRRADPLGDRRDRPRRLDPLRPLPPPARAAAKRYLGAGLPGDRARRPFLDTCRDAPNGLQCLANEDDSYTPSQTLHGAGPVLLGLRSAIAAAKAMGDTSPQVAPWHGRLADLRPAIEKLYDPATHSYGAGTRQRLQRRPTATAAGCCGPCACIPTPTRECAARQEP